MLDHLLRDIASRRIGGQCVDLQRKTFGQRARRESRSIQRLHETQRDHQLLFSQRGFDVDDVGEIGEILTQITVVIECFDHETRHFTVAVVEPVEA